RRELLLASGVLFAWAYLPKAARAQGRDPRLLVIVLRGALDGLATVAPVGDPDWNMVSGDRALPTDGPNAALELDGFFDFHPTTPSSGSRSSIAIPIRRLRARSRSAWAWRRSHAPAAWKTGPPSRRPAAPRRCWRSSRNPPAPRRNSWRARTDRGSARSPMTA